MDVDVEALLSPNVKVKKKKKKRKLEEDTDSSDVANASLAKRRKVGLHSYSPKCLFCFRKKKFGLLVG